ncbi:hypothetical protein MLD38_013112 [Melastoma candidum]|uniref:Uncharacterized protein n=1 Tax=Melastoma candidum TaxID=119954 RepID=A0ACB9R951_9MYRT|nr:hypothetical protein MLD38_013112 [Melastoma candidum]
MRMMMKRSVPAALASLNCIRRVVNNLHLSKGEGVLHFDYNHSLAIYLFEWITSKCQTSEVRIGDLPLAGLHLWTSSWHRVQNMLLLPELTDGVGTTYAQLVASLAAANSIGPLSCRGQPQQCCIHASSHPGLVGRPLESQYPSDIRRLAAYGVTLSSLGTVDEDALSSFCRGRKGVVEDRPGSRNVIRGHILPVLTRDTILELRSRSDYFLTVSVARSSAPFVVPQYG